MKLNSILIGAAIACLSAGAPAYSQESDPIPGKITVPQISSSWQSTWRLRGEFAIPSTTQRVVEIGEALKKSRLSSPFVLSYDRNDISDQTSLGLQGALFHTWGRDINDGGNLKIINYAAGVEVNQARIDDVVSNDTLSFEARTAALFQNSDPGAIITNHFLEAGMGWITDSDFELSVATLDAKYEPLTNNFGRFGQRERFLVQIKPSFLFEAQRVAEAADATQFQGEVDRLYAGGRIDMTAGFGDQTSEPFRRLSFDLDYTFMADLSDRDDDRELFTASVRWELNDSGTAVLSATYSEGQSTTDGPVDGVKVGLGFAF